MKISQLIDQLQQAMEEYGDKRIYAAIQPNYPLAVEIAGVGLTLDGESPDEARESAAEAGVDFDMDVFDNSDDAVFWINTSISPGDINPYAPRSAWDPIF